ncbi:MAG: GMC oxidoreductase [Nostoc sp. DedQUE01]|nr:GMC oxidoreductase [Nostoc sp. DedQUE11]MDZ8075075.1 GMC oxidoreductase [Nostoc sp. DedQUE01]MDZ8083174.1 GMC oxidoreductase [Nostoc sp. DcaGUA01]
MSGVIKRRQFIQATLAATASVGVSNIASAGYRGEECVEALVIGSGFGGAVAALRLGEAGIKTIVLERGRRWPITAAGNTFSTYEKPDGRSTWLSQSTVVFNPAKIDVYTGVLDVKVGDGIIVYRGAGVGGGSLVYNAVTYQPTKELFYQVFPRSIKYEELDKIYYPRVRSMLNASPIPDSILETDYYLANRILLQQAAKAGLKARKLDIAVDWDIVQQEIEGKKVASAIAGQVYYGLNSGAKNSLDRNYLSMAEATKKVEIRPLHVVTSIEEYHAGRFRVTCNKINEQGVVLAKKSFICRYLFLAAGSIGTTELLLRAKYNGTLRRLNDRVGKFWGTNGDGVTAIVTSGLTNPTLGGPASVVVEDLDNPIAPIVVEQLPLPIVPQTVLAPLSLAITKPEGCLTYNASTQSANLFWPKNSANNQKITQATLYTYQKINQANNTSFGKQPDLSATAHPLGGATMGAVCNTYGKVHGYSNLFVVDGSLIPGSTACTNPSLTIAALAERSMDRFLNKKLPESKEWE